MPPELISRANEILKILEQTRETGDGREEVKNKPLSNLIKKIAAPQLQLSIFDAHSATFALIRELLENMDINRLTPVDALMKLNEIKNLLK